MAGEARIIFLTPQGAVLHGFYGAPLGPPGFLAIEYWESSGRAHGGTREDAPRANQRCPDTPAPDGPVKAVRPGMPRVHEGFHALR
jgi:hypothetical protein